jgi:hypothetical protein
MTATADARSIILTNYGLRVAGASDGSHDRPRDPRAWFLDRLRVDLIAPYRLDSMRRGLLEEGLIHAVPASMAHEEIALRYRRNPLENVRQVVFEFTTRCNFNCMHCYNAGVRGTTGTSLESLKSAADTFARMGVKQFAFIGGEVSKYGDGWLELAGHIRSRTPGAEIALVTNGWWLGRKNLLAAGRRYPDAPSYLAHLKDQGVTRIIFSLDGDQEEHDRSRKHPGLYRRVLNGFPTVRAAGMLPQVALLVREKWYSAPPGDFLGEIADGLYGYLSGTSNWTKWTTLRDDPGNIIGHFIDIGNAARGARGRFRLADVRPEHLRCKGFFRPAPVLTIKASGELSTCRVADVGEGYGNLNREPLVTILNTMQERFVFRLHSEGKLGEYLPLINARLFGATFQHLCALRSIVTLVARTMNERGIDPGDRKGVLEVNRDVASRLGYACWSTPGTDSRRLRVTQP